MLTMSVTHCGRYLWLYGVVYIEKFGCRPRFIYIYWPHTCSQHAEVCKETFVAHTDIASTSNLVELLKIVKSLNMGMRAQIKC